MARHRSSQEWKDLLTAYESWEGSQAQFCLEYDISIASFYYQRRKNSDLLHKQLPAVVELARPQRIELGSPVAPADDACQIECHHPTIGPLKVHCQASQLAFIVGQLAQDQK